MGIQMVYKNLRLNPISPHWLSICPRSLSQGPLLWNPAWPFPMNLMNLMIFLQRIVRFLLMPKLGLFFLSLNRILNRKLCGHNLFPRNCHQSRWSCQYLAPRQLHTHRSRLLSRCLLFNRLRLPLNRIYHQLNRAYRRLTTHYLPTH